MADKKVTKIVGAVSAAVVSTTAIVALVTTIQPSSKQFNKKHKELMNNIQLAQNIMAWPENPEYAEAKAHLLQSLQNAEKNSNSDNYNTLDGANVSLKEALKQFYEKVKAPYLAEIEKLEVKGTELSKSANKDDYKAETDWISSKVKQLKDALNKALNPEELAPIKENAIQYLLDANNGQIMIDFLKKSYDRTIAEYDAYKAKASGEFESYYAHDTAHIDTLKNALTAKYDLTKQDFNEVLKYVEDYRKSQEASQGQTGTQVPHFTFGLETRWAIKDASDFIGYILHNVIVPYKELQAKIEAKADKDNYQSVLNEINTNIEEIKTDINNVVFKEGEYEINPYAPGEKYNKVPTYIKKLEETKKHEEAIEPVAAEIKKLSDKVAELETKDNKADYAAEITWINEQITSLRAELNSPEGVTKLEEIKEKAIDALEKANNGQIMIDFLKKSYDRTIAEYDAYKAKASGEFESYYAHDTAHIDTLKNALTAKYDLTKQDFNEVLKYVEDYRKSQEASQGQTGTQVPHFTFGLETRWAIKDASDFIGYILHNVIVPYKELQAKIEAKADKDNYQSVLNEINTNIEEIKTDINNVVFKEGEYEINPYAPGEKYNKVPTYIKKLEETKKHEEAIEPVAAEIQKLSDKVAELETKDNKADYAAEITWINEQVNTLNTELNQVTDFSKLAEITTKATNTITELNNGQTLLEQIIKDHKEALSKFEALKTESKKVAPFEPYYEHSVKTIELLVPKSETEFNKYLGSFTDVLELHKQINGKSDFKFDAQIYAVLEITDKFVKTVIQRYVATYFGLMLRFGNNLKNEAQVKENLNLIYHVLSSLYDVYEGELYISNVDYNKILSEFQKDLMKVMMANMPMPPRP